MKAKIKIIDNISNQVIYSETEIPNKDHLAAQIKYKSHKIKPKKGKGSYSRKKFKNFLSK